MDEKAYKIWISEAKNDFEGGQVLLKSNRHNLAVFHFSEAAEKAVKALLYYEGSKPWGHVILNLLLEYEKKGYSVPLQLKRYAQDLEKSYLDTRYPEISLMISPKEAKAIMDFVIEEKEELEKSGFKDQIP